MAKGTLFVRFELLTLLTVLAISPLCASYAETEGGGAMAFGQRASSSADAIRLAHAYTHGLIEANDGLPGVAVVIAYGTANGISAEEVGDAFVVELRRRGLEARYFYYDASWEGVTVEYQIGFSVRGPWPADQATANMGNIVELAKAAQRVHQSVEDESF